MLDLGKSWFPVRTPADKCCRCHNPEVKHRACQQLKGFPQSESPEQFTIADSLQNDGCKMLVFLVARNFRLSETLEASRNSDKPFHTGNRFEDRIIQPSF